MPGIGVINNPHSKKNRLHPERIRLQGYLLGEAGQSRTTQSIDELEACIDEFERRRIDILAINGGDGTGHLALTKLIEVYGQRGTPLPAIALLRGGTLNTIPRSFGIRGTPQFILHNLADHYSRGIPFRTMTANTIKANGRHSFLFGNGFIANFMHTYYTTGKPSPAHGVKVLVQGLASAAVGSSLAKQWFKPVEAEVTIDGEAFPLSTFSSILVGTVEDIGVGFKPLFRAFDESDAFHIVFYTCSPSAFGFELPFIYFARPLHPKNGTDTMAKCMTIRATEPFHYTQDGDMYTCEDGVMDIEIGPRLEMIIE